MLTEWLTEHTPIVIGGVGGSGTRVAAQAVQDAGVYIGSDLNTSLDNLRFSFLFKRQDLWPLDSHTEEIRFALELFSRIERGGHKLVLQEREYLERVSKIFRPHHGPDWIAARMLKMDECKDCDSANVVWGWKEPNSHIFLPELFRFFPRMRYVHVIRNGQDMAFSKNQSQANLWGDAFSKPDPALSAQRSFDYWCLAHERILGLMAQYPQQVMLLNFDKLCMSPTEGLEALYEFLCLEVPALEMRKQVGSITPPNSLGRHSFEAPLRVKPWQSRLLTELGFN